MRVRRRHASVLVVSAVLASAASGYIHFPPMTLPKFCKDSSHVRTLRVKAFNREKGVIVFEVAESLKGTNPKLTSFKHVLRPEARGAKPILDWAAEGKRAVMFSIEAAAHGNSMACGYVFIDDYCYSVDYNRAGEYWLLIRAEPNMSSCYHGPADHLRKLTKDALAGKEVRVPVKEPEVKGDRDVRFKEVNDVLIANRKK